jgi:hypothetical protein
MQAQKAFALSLRPSVLEIALFPGLVTIRFSPFALGLRLPVPMLAAH